MSRREQIRLDDDEVRAFLEKSQTVILVSNGRPSAAATF